MSRSFNGTSHYVRVSANAAMGLTHDFSISAWVWPDDFGLTSAILDSIESPAPLGFAFRVQQTNGRLALTTKEVKDYLSATATLTAGEWNHVGVALDVNDDATFYVDGVQKDTITHTAPGVANTTLDWLIGAGSGGVTADRFWFDGLIAEVGVIPRALSAPEFAALARGANLKYFAPVLHAPLWGVGAFELDLTKNRYTLSNIIGGTGANHPPVRPFTRPVSLIDALQSGIAPASYREFPKFLLRPEISQGRVF